MARLFKNQEDLLSEFGQFLPDANSSVVSTLGDRMKYLGQRSEKYAFAVAFLGCRKEVGGRLCFLATTCLLTYILNAIPLLKVIVLI